MRLFLEPVETFHDFVAFAHGNARAVAGDRHIARAASLSGFDCDPACGWTMPDRVFDEIDARLPQQPSVSAFSASAAPDVKRTAATAKFIRVFMFGPPNVSPNEESRHDHR